METKKCRVCGADKPTSEYRNKKTNIGGKRHECKICQNEYLKNYNEKNKILIKEQRKQFYDKNKDILLKTKKENYDLNKTKFIKRQSKYNRNKKLIDPLYKFKRNSRIMISKSLKNNGFTKKSSTFKILGCEFIFFIKYIESKFESWMSWENYGKYNGELNYGWDLDHIIPLFKANTEEEVIILNHYTNLQPLCAHITVDTILESYFRDSELRKDKTYWHPYDYWLNVKNEIDNIK